MLDPGEALKNQLTINTYENKLSKLFVGEGDRLMVVAFHKTNNATSSIVMFKNTPYDRPSFNGTSDFITNSQVHLTHQP